MKVTPIKYRLGLVGQRLKQIETELTNLQSIVAKALNDMVQLETVLTVAENNLNRPVLKEEHEAEPYDGLS